jgi:hypothetical protein
MADKITAPFTPDQVQQLAAWQARDDVHEYTCVHRDEVSHRGDGALVPTVRGWICPFCDYTQDWSHAPLETSVLVWRVETNSAVGEYHTAMVPPGGSGCMSLHAVVVYQTPDGDGAGWWNWSVSNDHDDYMMEDAGRECGGAPSLEDAKRQVETLVVTYARTLAQAVGLSAFDRSSRLVP